jgi:hypothetical protein
MHAFFVLNNLASPDFADSRRGTLSRYGLRVLGWGVPSIPPRLGNRRSDLLARIRHPSSRLELEAR